MKARISVSDCHASYPHHTYLTILSVLLIAAACLGQQTSQQPPGRQEPTRRQEPAGRRPARPRRVPPAQRLRTIQLPAATTDGGLSVERALLQHHNMQLPGNERLDYAKIGQLAWAAQGVMVASPTAGTSPVATGARGLAPVPPEATAIKVYFVVPDGLFLYNPVEHSLQQINDGDVRELMATSLLKRPGAPSGGCQIILAGSSRDFTPQYGTRARTVMLLKAGQMSQNIRLQALALGLTFLSIDNVQGTDVRRVARIARNLDPIYAIFVGYRPGEAPQQTTVTVPPANVNTNLNMAALLVLPPTGFQEDEYSQTRRALELAGVRVTVASSRVTPITGMVGGTAQADMPLNKVNLDKYSAVVFIGGIGAANYFNDPTALRLAREAAGRNKVTAAIGMAPSILAGADVLRGVRTTAYISEQNRLALAGALYTGNPVEKDGHIITATGPLAAGLFTQAILEGLTELQQP